MQQFENYIQTLQRNDSHDVLIDIFQSKSIILNVIFNNTNTEVSLTTIINNRKVQLIKLGIVKEELKDSLSIAIKKYVKVMIEKYFETNFTGSHYSINSDFYIKFKNNDLGKKNAYKCERYYCDEFNLYLEGLCLWSS